MVALTGDLSFRIKSFYFVCLTYLLIRGWEEGDGPRFIFVSKFMKVTDGRTGLYNYLAVYVMKNICKFTSDCHFVVLILTQ
jgi:hypothetical protein